MPKPLTLLLLLFLLAGCSQGSAGPRRQDPAAGPTPLPTAELSPQATYQVQRGDVLSELTFSARLGPAQESALAFARDGTVGSLFATPGDWVEAGALLAELDNATLAEQLLAAQAGLERAEQRLAAAQKQAAQQRRRAEIERDIAQLALDFAREEAAPAPTLEQSYQIRRLELELELAQLALDGVETSIDPQLQAEVERLGLQVAALEEAMQANGLHAPFAGQLLSFGLAPGQEVRAGGRVGTLADTSLLEVQATLTQAELEKLGEGMPASISAGDRPGELFAGIVRRLPLPYGSLGSNLGLPDGDQTARIAFLDPAQAATFALGERVRVTILVEKRQDVLWLPPAALRAFNGRDFVLLQEGRGQRRVDVTLGLEGQGKVEIVAGLEAGQTVIGP